MATPKHMPQCEYTCVQCSRWRSSKTNICKTTYCCDVGHSVGRPRYNLPPLPLIGSGSIRVRIFGMMVRRIRTDLWYDGQKDKTTDFELEDVSSNLAEYIAIKPKPKYVLHIFLSFFVVRLSACFTPFLLSFQAGILLVFHFLFCFLLL